MTWLSPVGIGSIRAAICPRITSLQWAWEEVGTPLMDFSNPPQVGGVEARMAR